MTNFRVVENVILIWSKSMLQFLLGFAIGGWGMRDLMNKATRVGISVKAGKNHFR